MDNQLLHNCLTAIFPNPQNQNTDVVYFLETNFEENHNCEINEIKVRKHSNGWISVYAAWQEKGKETKDFHKFKYPKLASKNFGYEDTSCTFEFPETKDPSGEATLTIGLQLKNPEEENGRIGYDPVFHENNKYGVTVWFAPKNWEDWNNCTLLEEFNVDQTAEENTLEDTPHDTQS
jgi:hypothetical protein